MVARQFPFSCWVVVIVVRNHVIGHVSAWSSSSPPPTPSSFSSSIVSGSGGGGPVEDRRTALTRISLGSVALFTSTLVAEPKAVHSEVVEEGSRLSPSLAFDTYNIIPDLGVNLDPKLEKVDVSSNCTRVWFR